MIYDHLTNILDYGCFAKNFGSVIDFLRKPDIANLEAGKYTIKAAKIFAMVQCPAQKGKTRAKLEAHRKFIDLHYVISGREIIGHSLLSKAVVPEARYNAGKDIQFFSGTPQSWLALEPGMFAVFFPQDLHAPLAGQGILKKIVVKIAV